MNTHVSVTSDFVQVLLIFIFIIVLFFLIISHYDFLRYKIFSNIRIPFIASFRENIKNFNPLSVYAYRDIVDAPYYMTTSGILIRLSHINKFDGEWNIVIDTYNFSNNPVLFAMREVEIEWEKEYSVHNDFSETIIQPFSGVMSTTKARAKSRKMPDCVKILYVDDSKIERYIVLDVNKNTYVL